MTALARNPDPALQRQHKYPVVDRSIQGDKLHRVPYPEPTTPKAYAHYVALKAASNYLKIDELEGGYIYIIHGRNSYLGVWRAELNGFTIVRSKLGVNRLCLEYHWDANGTAKPLLKLSGPVAADQRRQALDAAHALITHEKFMELTASLTQ